MGKRDDKPTIRILLLGPSGVGKNCLESRFTTLTYPPLYDPNLTLNSRRYFTLSDHPQDDHPSPTTRPLETSHGISTPLRTSAETPPPVLVRPRSASSTLSNPASEPRTHPLTQHPPSFFSAPDKLAPTPAPKLSLKTSHPNGNGYPTPPTPQTPTSHPVATYLVEITNYPALQSAKTRSQVLSRGEYDAVVLVYDVGSRASFDAIPGLHGEIPLSRRRRRGSRSVRRSRSSIFGGDRAVGNGGSPIDDFPGSGNANGNGTGNGVGNSTGETVVALVGNKSDFDVEYTSTDGDGEEKEATRQAAEVEARSLVHPLFRQSRVYEDAAVPTSPRSARSVPVGLWDHPGGGGGEVRRARSVISEGGQRVSVFSAAKRGSLNLVPEERRDESERDMIIAPPTPPEEPAAAIQKWLEIDSEPRSPDGRADLEDQRRTREVVPRQRQVSRFEGDMLARSLLLNVPFLETSAKTGENVEEAFEAVIKEVLRGMGIDVGGQSPIIKGEEKEGESPTLARKRSVLKKERKEEKREGSAHESPVSDRPPVLTLSGLDEEGHDTEDSADTPAPPAEAGHTEQPQEPAPPQKRKRESALGSFFKRVFTKKSAVMVPDIAA